MSQPPRTTARLPVVLAMTALGALLLGIFVFWSGRGSGDVREWTPADHDQPAGQSPQGRPKASPAKAQDNGNLIAMTWTKNCANCHGESGRGDGPQGSMFGAVDLTRIDWQGRVTDDEIAAIIRKGRNKMPAFELSQDLIQGLVRRIRASRAKP